MQKARHEYGGLQSQSCPRTPPGEFASAVASEGAGLVSDKEQAARDGASSITRLAPVSVVVIGRNEGARLVRCLESVLAADYPKELIELIYVDTNSTDDSCAAAERLGARVVPINPERPSAAAARNAGLKVARHELVQFLDGDTILNRDWLRVALNVLDDPSIACVFGRREEIRPRASLFMRVAAFDWHVTPGPARYCGGDAMFRRSVLGAVGGFDETMLAGEEPELCFRIRRLGHTIWRCDAPMTLHDLNMTRFGQYWRRGVRSGWAYVVVAARCHDSKERLWLRENAVNVIELTAWLVLLGLLIGTRQVWVLGVVLAFFVLRTTRIATNVRNRADSLMSAVLYALHCQFMRLPLAVGQAKGLWYLLHRRPVRLADYKR